MSTPLSTMFLAAAVTVLASPALAQDANPYEGFKVPPLAVSSEMPYEHKFIEILGSKMAYVEAGSGDPILFLHGQPTSSYLWRNIMPHLEGQGRVIAPDNIGFGKSDQPAIDYTFGDHYKYIEAFIEEMGLSDITLVVHDWGSGLGLHYAAQNPERIKGIVTMESILAPVMPADSYDAMPPALGDFFRTLRDPEGGPKLLIEQNYFVEGVLPAFIVRPLAKDAHDVYRAPFPTETSRIQINQWPNEVPIGRVPQETHDAVTAYNAWLEETELPWLFLYATPGALNPPAIAEYWTERANNIETAYIGPGLHYVQEDQPFAIGRAISDWYRRIEGQ
ncbi:MAG: haloalkane dehalogenase [Hyphomicrobiales bacterium]|nr:haloalkane dehalogenase [Hyphomicrobiales bacterium]